MLYRILSRLDRCIGFERADAHCDIPCKIYDPISAQLAALSVLRFVDLIQDIVAKDELSPSDQAQLSRLVREKEIHAGTVKDEVRTIWGDYFKQHQLEAFPDTHSLVHSIMQAGSACKQGIARESAEKLLSLVNEFAASFWKTKGVETFTAKCPYPPEEVVVYPKLN